MTVIIAIIVNLRVGRPIISNQILKLSSSPKLGHHTLTCFHFSSSLANSVEVNCQDQCNFLQKNELYWLWHKDLRPQLQKLNSKSWKKNAILTFASWFSLNARVHTASYMTAASSTLHFGAQCVCVVCSHIYRAVWQLRSRHYSGAGANRSSS